ncbi:hypothetical protein Tco_1379942 [Tanacetum coccineum]
MVEEVTSLKKDFKQKENKYLEEFLDMKALKEKVEDKLYKQDQSLQTVHMLCKPKPYYNEQNKVVIGYKNQLCLTRVKQVQSALYNGYEIIKNNHVPALVHNTLGYPSTLRNVSAMSVNALYQPWRAVLSMINMCLTGKIVGYDRPRHPVLQILWGITHRSNIDYAERIWEEFVQSIQNFLTNRKNLATASRGKKKTVLLLISNVRFTKLIIHHLRTKHNIHPRTGLPLHYSHDENILNTLRFVGKDGREISRMPIPDALLTDEIKGAPYYKDYQEHVTKYQQILDAERGKVEEGGATESSKATKVTKTKEAKVTKPAGNPAPKKRKLVKETPDDPLPAKRSKASLVGKRRKAKSPLRLIDKPSDEGVPVEEPAHDDEEADL